MADYTVEFYIRPSGRRSKVVENLTLKEAHHLLSLNPQEREVWIDMNIDYWIEQHLIDSLDLDWEVDSQVEIKGLPETAADLPPLVHPNQQVLL